MFEPSSLESDVSMWPSCSGYQAGKLLNLQELHLVVLTTPKKVSKILNCNN